jgi:glycosyltransferase involved in cell wall biosynthesis
MPTVSVIMPAYNVAQYLEDALGSVLAQTFRDFEVLVVDDGSADATVKIAQQFAARDARVRLLQQQHGGLSRARNTAIGSARGRFLALLDSDDMWHPQFLAAQLEVFERGPSDIVTGNALDLGGPRDGRPSRPFPDRRPVPGLATIIADIEAVFIMSMFRREVVARIGLFDETLQSNEDYDYWLRAAVAGMTFARNDRPLGYYRRRCDSLSANDVRMLSGVLAVYQKLRPRIVDRPFELALLDRQVERFSTELLAAQACVAIEAGDRETAAARLADLRRLRPGTAFILAELLARWAPRLLPMLYRARRNSRIRRHAEGAAA